ncbi:hypothetical protein K353_00256 [Kitasatospora sp. SolWspMP-SS2h]|nr:hypothetical protein K353_00256 [Kitasatospora sp. SolWspMP-SS2h]
MCARLGNTFSGRTRCTSGSRAATRTGTSWGVVRVSPRAVRDAGLSGAGRCGSTRGFGAVLPGARRVAARSVRSVRSVRWRRSSCPSGRGRSPGTEASSEAPPPARRRRSSRAAAQVHAGEPFQQFDRPDRARPLVLGDGRVNRPGQDGGAPGEQPIDRLGRRGVRADRLLPPVRGVGRAVDRPGGPEHRRALRDGLRADVLRRREPGRRRRTLPGRARRHPGLRRTRPGRVLPGLRPQPGPRALDRVVEVLRGRRPSRGSGLSLRRKSPWTSRGTACCNGNAPGHGRRRTGPGRTWGTPR